MTTREKLTRFFDDYAAEDKIQVYLIEESKGMIAVITVTNPSADLLTTEQRNGLMDQIIESNFPNEPSFMASISLAIEITAKTGLVAGDHYQLQVFSTADELIEFMRLTKEERWKRFFEAKSMFNEEDTDIDRS